MNPVIRLAIVIMLLPCSTCVAIGPQETRASARRRADSRNAFIRAKDPKQAAEAIKTLFSEICIEELSELRNDSHPGIRLFAMWQYRELNATQLGKDQVPFHPERFLGMLEGQTHLRCPYRWSALLAYYSSYDAKEEATKKSFKLLYRDSGVFDLIQRPPKKRTAVLALRSKSHKHESTGPQFAVRAGVKQLNGRIWKGKESFPLSQKFQDTLRAEQTEGIWKFNELGVEITATRAYVAAYDDSGRSFPLWCVDTNSGEVNWKARVWGNGELEDTIDLVPALHEVALASNETVVAVFGRGALGTYVETFDAKTGENIIRFSTYAWSR